MVFLVNVFDALFEATSGITATGATIINSVDDLPNTFCIMAWTYALDWWDGDYCPYFILLENLDADAAHMFNAEASVPKPGVNYASYSINGYKLWRLYIVFTGVLFPHAMGGWNRTI